MKYITMDSYRNFLIPGGLFPRVFVLVLLLTIECSSQSKNNMEIFYSLIDSSTGIAISDLPAGTKGVSLDLTLGDVYSVFGNRIISAFNEKGIKTDSSSLKVSFVVDNATVIYNEMFRDGLLGEYLVSRVISIEGNYFLEGTGVNKFSLTQQDTISVEDVSKAENFSYPFTHGEIPSEPFFSGLFEPVVAISTAAAVVVLFFTVRSH